MKNNIINSALLSSSTVLSSAVEIPKLLAIEIEMIPKFQTFEAYFSDAFHLLYITRGELFSQKETNVNNENVNHMFKRVSTDSESPVLNWVCNINIEDSFVDFQGSDDVKANVVWSKLRPFLPSTLEDDLKYRFEIDEVYIDQSNIKIKFIFDSRSYNKVSSREMLLRLNYIPTRLVKRLVNNK
jgi:hypothetical protein